MFAQAVVYLAVTTIVAALVAVVGIQLSAAAGIIACLVAIAAEVGCMVHIERKASALAA